MQKIIFYDNMAQTFVELSGNVIKLVLGDLNANYGRGTHFMPMTGRESLVRYKQFIHKRAL